MAWSLAWLHFLMGTGQTRVTCGLLTGKGTRAWLMTGSAVRHVTQEKAGVLAQTAGTSTTDQGLKQQAFIVSDSWRPEAEIHVSQGCSC